MSGDRSTETTRLPASVAVERSSGVTPSTSDKGSCGRSVRRNAAIAARANAVSSGQGRSGGPSNAHCFAIFCQCCAAEEPTHPSRSDRVI
ncbi:MAG: hypothetical protein WEF50_16525 [Myxococcota bacterium]